MSGNVGPMIKILVLMLLKVKFLSQMLLLAFQKLSQKDLIVLESLDKEKKERLGGENIHV